jgi:hypothetical protein
MATTVVAADPEDTMDVQARTDRWLTAVAIPLVPFLLLLVPAVLLPSDYATAEEQFADLAGKPFPYWSLAVQASGAVFLLPAVLGVLQLVRRRRRGVVLGSVGAALGLAGMIALLLVLGIELAMAFLVEDGRRPAVELALALSDWEVNAILLVVGLAAPFLALPVLALALRRSRVVPLVVPVLFLAPLAAGFVPMPGVAANLVPIVLMVVPAVWMAVRLVRLPPTSSEPAREPASERSAPRDEVLA